MLQEYKLKSFEKGDFTDPHGNYWCTATFEGIGEPVKWVVKDPNRPQIGESYYGEIKQMTSKANRPYLRFYKQQEPEQNSQVSLPGTNVPKKEWQPRDDDAIKSQWAIGQAVQLSLANGHLELENVENDARKLYSMVDRVKTALIQQREAVDQVFEPENQGEPINLDDIPF